MAALSLSLTHSPCAAAERKKVFLSCDRYLLTHTHTVKGEHEHRVRKLVKNELDDQVEKSVSRDIDKTFESAC